MPRHPSFLLKINTCSLSLTCEEGVPTLSSIKHARTLSIPHSLPLSLSLSVPPSFSLSLPLSLSLSLTGEEGVRTLASIKHARTLSIPHSVSQSACVIIILMPLKYFRFNAANQINGLAYFVRAVSYA